SRPSLHHGERAELPIERECSRQRGESSMVRRSATRRPGAWAAADRESELDSQALPPRLVAEQLCRACDALEHGVAVGVEARGGAWCVLGLLEEGAERVAQTCC